MFQEPETRKCIVRSGETWVEWSGALEPPSKEGSESHPEWRWKYFITGENGIALVSVLASEYAYCSPRVFHDEPKSYLELEIALLGKNGLIGPEGILPEEYHDLWQSGPSPVASYVPTTTIVEMLNATMA